MAMTRNDVPAMPCEESGSGPAHRVTPVMVARGNELLAQAKGAADRAMQLQRAIDEFERLKDAAWSEARDCRLDATRLMLGDARFY